MKFTTLSTLGLLSISILGKDIFLIPILFLLLIISISRKSLPRHFVVSPIFSLPFHNDLITAISLELALLSRW
jgi:hypothetical protein